MHRSLDCDRRGQLILIGAVLLAISILGLSLLLNAMTYTRTLTADHETDFGDGALGYRNHVEEGMGGVVFYTNYGERGGYELLNESFQNTHGGWRNVTSRHYTVDGVSATTTVSSTTNGSQIYQPASDPLTNAGGNADWTLATGLSGTRRFRMDVSTSSLSTATSVDDASDLSGAGLFHVVVSNASKTWKLYLYTDGGGDPTAAIVEDGTLNGTCEGAGSSLTVDLTEETVSDESCAPLTFPNMTGGYDITYENGDSAEGKYVAVVDAENSALSDGDFREPEAGDGPHLARALYSATVEIHYRSPRVTYRTTVVVTPETTPRGPVYDVPVDESGRELVYADLVEQLHSIGPNGTVTTYDAPAVQAIGPKEIDFDSDDRLEIPYVNSSGSLLLIDDTNETQELVENGNARQSKTLVGVGTWRGTTSVFYVNTSDGVIYRVRPGADPTMVTKSPGGDTQVSAKAVLGVDDYNGDGDPDLVYTGDSQRVWYVDDGSTTDTGETVGQNNGIGAGAPRHVFKNATSYVPFVDGDQTIELLDHEKNVITLGGGDDVKAPVAAADWVGDDRLDVFYVDGSDTLYYFEVDGTTQQVTDADGNAVSVNDDSGVA